ncbi:MAG TPA: hypothetical protein VN364_14160 [Bellilinea sp.]|nr:hypothetical protein [Bellilinea sp.]
MRAPLSTAIAIAAGGLTLLGLLIPVDPLVAIRTRLVEWVIVLAGVAGLVAIVHLLSVHWRKMTARRNKNFNSAFLLIAFVITFITGITLKPSHPTMQRIVTHIQVPIEASLMGVLAISLTVAAIRLFQKRGGWMSIVFAISAFVFLVIGSGLLSASANIPVLKDVLAAVNALPIAGARGILMGVALGSLTTGLRVLLGSDRPYSG